MLTPSGAEKVERFKLPHRAHPFWIKLSQACPLGPCSPAIVYCWAETVLPSLQERNYRHVQRTLASWWSRIENRDLARARARLEEVSDPSVPIVVPQCPEALRGLLPFREL